MRSRSRPVSRERKSFELALTTEAFFLASLQFSANPAAEDISEALCGIDAEAKDENLLSRFPVLKYFVDNAGQFGVPVIMTLVRHAKQEIHIQTTCGGILQ